MNKSVFEETKIKNMLISSRVGVPPMCTYMCKTNDGVSSNFHLAHYTTLAIGKPGFIIQEATSVDENGYLDDFGLGIYTKQQTTALKNIVDSVHEHSVKMGVQLNHAGCKSKSTNKTVYAASKLEDYETQLTIEEIESIVDAFKNAAKNAKIAGYDFIEIHGAHGYLINQFLSPLKNKRTDKYGADKTLLLQQVIKACQSEFDGPIGVRVSAEEYADGGNHLDYFVELAPKLEKWGMDFINVSTGGVVYHPIELSAMYQVKHAHAIKEVVNIPVMCAGLITKEEEIESIIHTNQSDYVLIGRELLRNPFFTLKWMKELGLLNEENTPNYLYRSLR